MDTDDLTPMADETLSLAYRVCEPMRGEIGMLAGDYRTEDEFLRNVRKFLKEILKEPEEYLDYLNLLDETELDVFVEGVRRLLDYVSATMRTPRERRGKPPFER